MHHRSLPERIWRWVLFGGTCGLIQILLTWYLSDYLSVFAAGLIAYSISGQINFVLHSVFTWSDRHPNIPFGLRWLQIVSFRWLKFLAVNLSAAAINGGLQWLTYEAYGDRIIAFILAGIVSTPYNLIMQDKVVFKNDEPPTELVERIE